MSEHFTIDKYFPKTLDEIISEQRDKYSLRLARGNAAMRERIM